MSLTKDSIQFRCMSCREMVHVQATAIGRCISCPCCGFTLFVPSVQNAAEEHPRDRLSPEKRRQLKQQCRRHRKVRSVCQIAALINGGLALIFGLAVIVLFGLGWSQNSYRVLFWCIFFCMTTDTCLARFKGRSWLWGLSGLAGLVGFVVPLLLQDLRCSYIRGLDQVLQFDGWLR